MKYVLLPLLLIGCGDEEKDSAIEETAEEQELENQEDSSEQSEQ